MHSHTSLATLIDLDNLVITIFLSGVTATSRAFLNTLGIAFPVTPNKTSNLAPSMSY